eukprot:363976-Chlamydomonas_euryale.AAC.4
MAAGAAAPATAEQKTHTPELDVTAATAVATDAASPSVLRARQLPTTPHTLLQLATSPWPRGWCAGGVARRRAKSVEVSDRCTRGHGARVAGPNMCMRVVGGGRHWLLASYPRLWDLICFVWGASTSNVDS